MVTRSVKLRLDSLFAAAALALLVACSVPDDAAAPLPPKNVFSAPQPGRILVTWLDVSDDEAGFIVHREEVSERGEAVSPLVVAGSTGPDVEEFLDTGAKPDVNYRYSVAAYNALGTSARTVQENDPVTRLSLLHSMTIAVAGSGSGNVASQPAGIACPPDCAADFEAGTVVVLEAQAGPGSAFVGWSGACWSAQPTCEVTLSSDMHVDATFARTAEPADWIVVTSTSGGTGGPNCTLRDAIAAANTDAAVGGCQAGGGSDTIALPVGSVISLLATDNDASGPNGLPSITSDIVIEGRGAIVQRGGTSTEFRLFHVGQGGHLVLRDTTVRNGHGGALGGGGILIEGGSAELFASTVSENRATPGVASRGAGVLNLGGDLTVIASVLSHNDMADLSGRLGPASGAAIAVVDGNLAITDSLLTGNRAQNVAGILAVGATSTTTIENTQISDNHGLAFDNEGSLWLTEAELIGNAMDSGVSGLRNSGSAYLERVTFGGSYGEFGTRLGNSGYLELRDSLVSGHHGSEFGDGIITNTGTMHVYDTQILDNSLFNGGGAAAYAVVDNRGVMSLTGSVISGSRGYRGGAAHNSGQLELRDTVLADNLALLDGGGVYNSGSLYLMGSTSIGDSGGGNGAWRHGGGIYAAVGSASFVCETCSVSGNRADADADADGAGGGLYLEPGAFAFGVSDSTVFGNLPDDVYP